MPSRLSAIRGKIESHVATAFSGIKITNEPIQLGALDNSQFPHAMILFAEEEPERLEFKQERRRVVGSIEIAVLTTAGDTAEATRETVDNNMEVLRDLIFLDHDLTATVDYVSCDAAVTFSGTEDTFVYGTIDIRAEEVF